MASKGTIAKATVEKKIAEAFGADFLGISDKKIYLNVSDGGAEKIQVALSMTCPKTPVDFGVSATPVTTLSEKEINEIPPWEDIPTFTPKKAEITQEERENVYKLMEKLGL